jgi:hypothetical protein
MRTSLAPPPRRPFGRRDVLLAFVDPRRAFTSSPESGPGYVFLLSLVAAPFVFVAAGPGPAARACAAMAAISIALASLGARLASRAQARDAAAFEKATQARPAEKAAAQAPLPEDESAEEPASAAGRVFALATLFVLTAPLAAAFLIELSKSVTQLAPFTPILRGLAVLGLAANPLTALEPIAEAAFGAPTVAPATSSFLGVDATTLFVIHLTLWTTIALVSLLSLRRAREVTLATA